MSFEGLFQQRLRTLHQMLTRIDQLLVGNTGRAVACASGRAATS